MPHVGITKHSPFHKSVYTEIVINAPKEKVWKAITNFDQMSQWSRSLQRIDGEIKENSKVTLHYFFQGKVKYFRVKLIGVEPGTQFGWSEPLIPFAKDKHVYRIESLSENTSLFIQTDRIKGISTPFIGKLITGHMLHHFTVYNESLKKFVENMK